MLQAYLLIGAALFCIGIYGVLTRRNAVGILMSIELMLNATNINLVAFWRFIQPFGFIPTKPADPFTGQIFAIFVITIAAAEAAVGLAIILCIYRNMEHINVDEINFLRW
ncbi:MAG: NADH-quinone oxidoreductase subunit NuoK [Armatimonadetes bacterium]|nr:NADH-quinone oxidoreductase subunit NuoK [Armatimonadota bacterium]